MGQLKNEIHSIILAFSIKAHFHSVGRIFIVYVDGDVSMLSIHNHLLPLVQRGVWRFRVVHNVVLKQMISVLFFNDVKRVIYVIELNFTVIRSLLLYPLSLLNSYCDSSIGSFGRLPGNIKSIWHRGCFDAQRSTSRPSNVNVHEFFRRVHHVYGLEPVYYGLKFKGRRDNLASSSATPSCRLRNQFAHWTVGGINWRDIVNTELVLRYHKTQIKHLEAC